MRRILASAATVWLSGLFFGISLSCLFATNGIGIERPEKPANEPTFETHRDVAVELCGGPVIKPGPETYATHVIVVKLDGSLVRMPIDEAWDRAESESRADDIWSIAVCKSDIVNPNVRKV